MLIGTFRKQITFQIFPQPLICLSLTIPCFSTCYVCICYEHYALLNILTLCLTLSSRGCPLYLQALTTTLKEKKIFCWWLCTLGEVQFKEVEVLPNFLNSVLCRDYEGGQELNHEYIRKHKICYCFRWKWKPFMWHWQSCFVKVFIPLKPLDSSVDEWEQHHMKMR